MIVVGKRIEKNNKKKKEEWKEITAETQRWEKRTGQKTELRKKRFSAFARRWQDICALILHSFSLFPLLLAEAATKQSTTGIHRGGKEVKWNNEFDITCQSKELAIYL